MRITLDQIRELTKDLNALEQKINSHLGYALSAGEEEARLISAAELIEDARLKVEGVQEREEHRIIERNPTVQ